MSKKLSELFNLPDDGDESQNQYINPIGDDSESIAEFLSQDTQNVLEKIENSLPAVKGLESSDRDMDELADLAKGAFENLMDMGMQTDPRFASEIFNSASSFLGHSITAKTAKINKKLKMVSLQLQKAELDRKLAAADKSSTPSETTPLGTGQVIDRSELIRQVLEQSKNAFGDK